MSDQEGTLIDRLHDPNTGEGRIAYAIKKGYSDVKTVIDSPR